MTFSEGDTNREVVPGIHRDFLKSKNPLRNYFWPPKFHGGREGGATPEVAMPYIEKERGWAKPNQLPAGPRKNGGFATVVF